MIRHKSKAGGNVMKAFAGCADERDSIFFNETQRVENPSG